MNGASWIHGLALGLAIAFNILANFSFKQAVRPGLAQPALTVALGILGSAWFWVGIGCSVALLASYLYALRGLPLFVAYPAVTGLAMVGIAIVSTAFFGAALGFAQYLGVLCVILGIALLST